MDYPNPNIFLSKNEQNKIRKLLGPVKTISDYLSQAANYLKEGKDWARSLTESAPWLKDVGEAAGDALPFIKVAVKLAEKWLEQTHPYELGAVACTLAYQEAARKAIEEVWTSAIGYGDAMKVDGRLAEQLRNLPPAEEVDLSTFTYSTALRHLFVRRADKILSELMRSGGFSEEMRRGGFYKVHTTFVENLKLLLTDKRTAERFAPFKERLELGSDELLARAALQIHADYQCNQYLAEPLFKREPYALRHIYVDTECGKLTWGQIRKSQFDPFSENHGGRHNLLETVMNYITDSKFNEPIVIQGIAGAGKSSFTLRLCAKLCEQGFNTIRIRLKRLRLTTSIIQALNEAIELEDEERLAELPFACPKDLLLNGSIFNTPYGDNHSLSCYVLILDGWDELDLSDNKSFREKVGEMLREVRRKFFGPQQTRVRVIVTGRPSIDVTNNRFLNDDTPILTLRPIRTQQLRDFVKCLDDALRSKPIAVENPEDWNVPSLTTLDEVFKKYDVAFKNRKQSAWFSNGRYASESNSLEVLGLPLLAYLTIRVLSYMVKNCGPLERQRAIINELVNNPTQLYRSLIDLTCEKAGKAVFDARDRCDEVERQAREVGLKLRERLRCTAAAISVLGKEHISRDEWIRRVQQKNQKDIEEERQRVDVAEDHPMSKLMISFYFKGGQPEQGCEFAHKSFREYLFAECIVETLKDYGRKLEVREVERMRLRNYWRDFSPSEDRPRYKFSRALAELLAPQWLTPEVLNHLESLIAWEIARAKEKTNKDGSRNLIIESLGGLPTQSLDFERWKWVRDGFADMWHWWCDGAHLRPQVRTERWKKSEIERTYVDELIRWAAPLAIEEDENLQLESATSIDAHLGDALCQICAMVHFFIARNEGWDWREPSQVRFVEPEKISRYQIAVSYREVNVRLFAPGCISTAQENISRKFTRYIARINAAFGRPRGDFPGHTFLNGAILFFMDLDGARFVNASLVGTRFERGSIYFDRDDFDLIAFGSIRDANLNDAMLEGAVLDCIDFAGANMSGATLKDTSLIRTSLRGVDLSDVHFLTREQIESALIDEYTKLPEDLEIFKPEILERQRQQEEELEEEMRTLEMEAGLDPGYEPEF